MQVSCNHANKLTNIENRAKKVLIFPVSFDFLFTVTFVYSCQGQTEAFFNFAEMPSAVVFPTGYSGTIFPLNE